MRGKKLLAGVLAVTMVASYLPGTSYLTTKVAAGESTSLADTKELELKFDGTVSDTSKNAFATSLKGTETYVTGVDGKALSLDGSTYLDLGTSGKLQPENLTFSCWVKAPELLSGEHILVWNKPSGNYAGDGWYLSILNDSVPLKISVGQSANGDQPTEAYVNSDRAAFFPKGEWVHIAVTYDSTSKEACIYRNGVAQKVSYVNSNEQKIVSNETDHKYIGFNSPGYNGGYAKVQLDDLELYSEVATKAEIKTIYSEFGTEEDKEEEMTKEEIVAEDLNALNFSSTELIEDIALETKGENGSTITWESSNDKVLNAKGAVTRPAAGEEDESVTLTATVSYDGYSKQKTFGLKVLAYSSETGESDFALDQVEVTDQYLTNAEEKDMEFLKELDSDRLLANFRKTAGITTTASCYNGWENSLIGGHTMGHYLSAAAQAVLTTGDKELKEKLEGMVSALKECQDQTGTGFIFGAKVINTSNVEIQFDNVEQNKTNIVTQAWVPWYTMHKLIAGLVDVYKYTGNEEALTVASNLGDWTYHRVSKWSDTTRNRVLGIEYGGMNDCLYELYKYSKNENHAAAAHIFDQDSLFQKVSAGGRNILNGQHANTTIPKFLGALNRYRIVGDKVYLQYAEDFFDMVLENHTYITGGNSEWEHFGEDKILDSERTQCNCETCNTYNMLKLARELFKITGEKKYADYYESTFRNAILSSINSENGMTTYFQPMATGYFKVFQNANLNQNQFWCCTGSGMENFTKMGDSIYYHTDSSIVVNQYISSVLTWKEGNIKLTQETKIPTASDTTLKIQLLNGVSSVTKTIRLRIPDWMSGSPVIKLNGKEVKATISGGYVELNREWKENDTISVTLPMKVVAYTLPDDTTSYAFKYGPIVLSADLGTDDQMSTTTCGVAVSIPKTKVVGTESASPSDGARTVLGTETITVKDETVAEYMENINQYLVKDKDSLAFTLTGTDHDLTFTPHYSKTNERYGIYWYFTGENLKSQQKKILMQKEEGREAEAKLDVVECGYGQYENDELHDMQETESATNNEIKISRYAKAGGSFSYRMKVDKSTKNYLLCQFAKADNGKTIKITAKDTVIANETLNYSGKEEVYTVKYEIPDSIVQAAESVSEKAYDMVRIQFASANNEESARVIEFLYTQRAFSSNAAITSLTASQGTVAETENGYTVTVPYDTKKVSLTTAIADKYGLLYIDGILVNDSNAYTVSLEGDTTTLLFKVFGEDHTTVKEYSITIVKQEQKPEEVKAESISVSTESETITEGTSFTFTAEVKPENATNKGIIATSTNEKVATVEGTKVTGVAAGTAQIVVMATDGSGVTATIKVTVTKKAPTEVKVTSIAVTPKEKTILAGAAFSYQVAILPVNATNQKVTVTSSNTKVATVSGTKVTGVAPGTATITIASLDGSNKKATIKVTVTKLTAPKHIKAVQQDETKVMVTYDKVNEATSYVIYRSTKKSSGYKKIGTSKKTYYKDRTVVAGKTYYYKVVAAGKSVTANSAPSGKAKVSVLAKPKVTLKSSVAGKVKISWNRVSGATGYEVYTTTGTKYKKAVVVKNGKITSVTLKKQKSGKKLSVKVRAYTMVDGKKVYGVYSKTNKVKVK